MEYPLPRGATWRVLLPLLLACSKSKGDSALSQDLRRASYALPPDTTLARLRAEGSRRAALPRYVVAHSWHPNNEPNGLGLDLIVSPSVSEVQIIALVRSLGAGHDPVDIGIYLSSEAYDDGRTRNPGDAFARGFVGSYIKNLTSGGAFQGVNEFKWMQEQGRFQAKQGTHTQFSEP
jgi:hypothetical protein